MNKPFVGSFTSLKTYADICQHQMFRRYVKRDIPYKETEAMAWGTKVHKAFEQRLGRIKRPLPPDMAKWEHFAAPFDKYTPVFSELQLGITRTGKPCGFFDDDVWFRGKVDMAACQVPRAFIIDYKTGSSKYEDPLELETSAMLLMAHYPLTEVVGSYAWLNENRMSQQYDLSNFDGTWAYVVELMDEIETKIEHGLEWEKKKSGLCGWCDVQDCENWRART